jgi:hypothetical protein
MKARFEEWRKLTGNAKPIIANAVAAPIRILDVPGFREVEDNLLLYAPHLSTWPPDFVALFDDLSKQTFGVTNKETLFENPDHEDQFDTAEATDDEAVKILLQLGLDFRDEYGFPLRCVMLFCRQAEAAAKGTMGKMPDRASIGLESWAKALKRDAEQYVRKKR